MPNNHPVTRRDAIARLGALFAGGLSLTALATAVEGLGSPGPSSPGFSDIFIKKKPGFNPSMTDTVNIIHPVADVPNLVLEKQTAAENPNSHGPVLRLQDQDVGLWTINIGNDGSFRPAITIDPGTAIQVNVLSVSTASLLLYLNGADPLFPNNQVTRVGAFITEFDADQLVNGGGFAVNTTQDINFLTSGAQVGLTTGITGGQPAGLSLGNHRHAFSGRFYVGGFLQTSVLAGNPVKFARFKVANNFTVRRISVYALTAPVGNGETWGIVNAAGTTQGTAVALNGGVQENEAAQTTNLTGGTAYYLAQIGVAATTPSANVNLEVEYTMNV